MTEEMIQPGDPRHPCPICSGRKKAFHMRACRPVPLSEAYVKPEVQIDPKLCQCANDRRRGIASLCMMCSGPVGEAFTNAVNNAMEGKGK